MTEPERREIHRGDWVAAVSAAREEGFAFFDWLSAVDATDAAEQPGFDIVCHLMDVGTPRRLRRVLLRTRVPDGEPLPSITGVFRGAAWHERETHEMFGIDVDGFQDGSGLGLRPLLLPDGFEGTPLRKSFVLAARAAKPWPGGKEPGEGEQPTHGTGTGTDTGTGAGAGAGSGSGSGSKASARRRVTAPGVPGPEWGPR